MSKGCRHPGSDQEEMVPPDQSWSLFGSEATPQHTAAEQQAGSHQHQASRFRPGNNLHVRTHYGAIPPVREGQIKEQLRKEALPAATSEEVQSRQQLRIHKLHIDAAIQAALVGFVVKGHVGELAVFVTENLGARSVVEGALKEFGH